MNEMTEILVVGAGAIGASCAAHLACGGHQVAVVDAQAEAAGGSTGRSFGAVRGQWADALNIALSWESIQQLRYFQEQHGVDIGYRPIGYLMLVPEADWPSQLSAVDLQRSYGVPVEVMDVREAAGITPFEPEGIGGATWCPADGVIDPRRLTTAYLGMAEAAGAEVLFSHPVKAVGEGSDGAWTVEAGGRVITAQTLVNAAGGWAGELAALAGLSVPVEHSRRSIYAASSAGLGREVPMTIDLSSGVFVRTRGQHVAFSMAPPDQAPGYFDTPDWDWFDRFYPAATARFPWLADLTLDREAAWGGTYEVTPDLQGILGPDPGAPTWINACGFSGHGLMQAPVIGQLVAEQVDHGAVSSFDLTGLRLDRFASTAHLSRTGLVF